jgi:hypothetical protein
MPVWEKAASKPHYKSFALALICWDGEAGTATIKQSAESDVHIYGNGWVFYLLHHKFADCTADLCVCSARSLQEDVVFPQALAFPPGLPT